MLWACFRAFTQPGSLYQLVITLHGWHRFSVCGGSLYISRLSVAACSSEEKVTTTEPTDLARNRERERE